jgi:DNA-binding GntR family transcriptional regulator
MGTSTEPVYLRVLDDLRSRIASGLLPPGARVPSRNAIITNYGVGETAAKHALAVLISEGLIEARPGSGSYVRRAQTGGWLEHDRPRFPGSPFGLRDGEDPSRNGSTARRLTWEHQSDQASAPPWAAIRLGLASGAMVVLTTYLMRADGEPVQLAVSCEPAGLAAGTPVGLPEQGPLAGRGVTERMTSIGIEVTEVVEEISARPAALAEASVLATPPGAQVIVVERAHYAGPRPVEAAQVVIPAERYRLRYRFPLNGRPAT